MSTVTGWGDTNSYWVHGEGWWVQSLDEEGWLQSPLYWPGREVVNSVTILWSLLVRIRPTEIAPISVYVTFAVFVNVWGRVATARRGLSGRVRDEPWLRPGVQTHRQRALQQRTVSHLELRELGTGEYLGDRAGRGLAVGKASPVRIGPESGDGRIWERAGQGDEVRWGLMYGQKMETVDRPELHGSCRVVNTRERWGFRVWENMG